MTCTTAASSTYQAAMTLQYARCYAFPAPYVNWIYVIEARNSELMT